MTTKHNQSFSAKKAFNQVKNSLLDPLAKELASHLQWKELKGLSKDKEDLYPVVISGEGSPIILLHGFDSCFLEFRRITPYLRKKHMLIIPDLFGFGFTPRHKENEYGLEMIIEHLNKIMDNFSEFKTFGLIGASMGGGIALEVARRNAQRINQLLLLSPAGVTGKPKRIVTPFDKLGVCILKNKLVRNSLCKQAFADGERSVGSKEKQIASIHLSVPGWGDSLAAFARSGGIAGCGTPQPNQPLKVIWGKSDKILNNSQMNLSKKVLNCSHEELSECGHLPHLDQPERVSKICEDFYLK